MDERSPDKLQQLLSALRRGMVMVHLDARRPGVVVPAEFSAEPHLRLNLSYRFRPRDLSVGEWGVCSTLSFSGRRFTVSFPWSALFAIPRHASKEFWTFPEAMPPEVTQPAAYRN
jgi:stringent starvation protein B